MKHTSFTGLEALQYDQDVPDWPGEIEFYRALALQTKGRDEAVLEVACGTGRVAARLAGDGMRITGMDLSEDMLAIARQKTGNLPNARWVQADMRSFDLQEQFGLVLIPGHSFLFMLTPPDQISCLQSIHRHLLPGGLLVAHLDHQDPAWLGEIGTTKYGLFEPGKDRKDPGTGNRIQVSFAWSYDRCTQIATLKRAWKEVDPEGKELELWDWEPERFHCVFRYEMEHMLERTGFELVELYGDFSRQALRNDSPEMIYVARRWKKE